MVALVIKDAGIPQGASLVAQVVKNPPANAGDACSIPGWGRSPGEGKAAHFSILAWGSPWTEKPGGLQSMGTRKSWPHLSN